MIDQSEFLALVTPHVAGCPNPIVRDAIRSTCADFCRETNIWRELLDPIPIEAGRADYELPAPSQTLVVLLHEMTALGEPIDPKASQWLDGHWSQWRTQVGPRPRYYTQDAPNVIRLVPIPDVDIPDGLADMRVSLQPTHTATRVGDIVFREFADGIKAGALVRLMLIPNQAWSNADLANYYRAEFQQAKDTAILRAVRQFSRAIEYTRRRKLPGAP